MVFQRKTPAKRAAKTYQTEEISVKKPRNIKRNIIKGESTAAFAQDYSTEEIYQKIQERAYQIFEQRGYSHGDDLADWLRAEKEIIAEINGNESSLN